MTDPVTIDGLAPYAEAQADDTLPVARSGVAGSLTAEQMVDFARDTLQGAEVDIRAAPLSGASSGTVDLSSVTAGRSVRITGGAPTYNAVVACVATSNVTKSGEQTIDGVLTSASRVLLTAQTTASDNGIWVTAAGAWSRATDADNYIDLTDDGVSNPTLSNGHCDDEVSNGQNVKVTGGTTNHDTTWTLTTANPITLGTTSLTYTKDSPAKAHNLTFTNPAQTFTITGFTGMVAGGLPFTVRFGGTFKLTHSADFYLSNSGQDYLTMAGDMAIVFPTGADSCRVKLYPFNDVMTVLDQRANDGGAQRDIEFGSYSSSNPPALRIAQRYSRRKVELSGAIFKDGNGDGADAAFSSVQADGSVWPGAVPISTIYSWVPTVDLTAGSISTATHNTGRQAQIYMLQLETPTGLTRGGGLAFGVPNVGTTLAGETVPWDTLYVMPTKSNTGRGIVLVGRAAVEDVGGGVTAVNYNYGGSDYSKIFNASSAWEYGAATNPARGAITIAMSDEAANFPGLALRTVASPDEGFDFRWNTSASELRLGKVTGDTYTAKWGWTKANGDMLPVTTNDVSIGSSTRRVSSIFASAADIAGNGGPGPLTLSRATSTASTSVGQIAFKGQNSTPTTISYGAIDTLIGTSTAGSEAGFMWFRTTAPGGSLTGRFRLGLGLYAEGLTDPGTGCGRFIDLYSTGNTTLGDAAADTVTINAKSVTKPNAPAFAANVGSDVTDVTGDGTTYTVIFNTEIFDRGGDYDPTTGEFTAPVTGRYQLNAFVQIGGVLSAHTDFYILLLAGSKTYVLNRGDVTGGAATNSPASLQIASLVSMAAGETAKVQIQVNGSTKVIDVLAGTTSSTFSGFMVG